MYHTTKGPSGEADLFGYIEILSRYRHLIAGMVSIAVAAAVVISWWLVPPAFEAVSYVQVGQEDLVLGPPSVYQTILLSRKVLTRTAESGRVSVQRLRAVAKVEISPNSNVLKLTVKSSTPQDAEFLGAKWYGAFHEETAALWRDWLERKLAVQQARIDGMTSLLSSDTQQTAGRNGQTPGMLALLEANSDVVAEAAGEVRRLEVLQDRIRQNKTDDVLVISEFEAGPRPVGPSRIARVVTAALISLAVSALMALTIEGWREHRQAKDAVAQAHNCEKRS